MSLIARARCPLAVLLGAVLLAPALVTTALAQNAAANPPANGEANAALQQRVDQLEEQLVDMQVVVGTLESLARGGGAAAAPAASTSTGYGGADPRVDALETQVRALTAQIEQLTSQVQSLSGGGDRRGAAPQVSSDTDFAAAPPATETTHFGSTTVTAGSGDPIGGMIENEVPQGAPSSQMAAAPPAFMPPPGGADSGNPKQLYETAYGYLMQRDYGAAQVAFEDFLNRYPSDSLAGNAQYWLGEAHFVRGEYKAAAGAFLKGYQNYGSNARAADSLLKLAMSLDRLGQKDAACTSFSELSTRFPNAPDNVKDRAQSERQRIGCTS